MAVVFISPKERQKVFFMGITIIFVLFLIFVSSMVFLSKAKEVSPELVFNKPKVAIDMSVFESDQFKNLQPFPEMEMQYSYKALTQKNEGRTGFINAASKEEATKKLVDMGLTVSEIKEVETGRDNPFIPYY
jgi:hypothetical protein